MLVDGYGNEVSPMLIVLWRGLRQCSVFIFTCAGTPADGNGPNPAGQGGINAELVPSASADCRRSLDLLPSPEKCDRPAGGEALTYICPDFETHQSDRELIPKSSGFHRRLRKGGLSRLERAINSFGKDTDG